MKTYSLTPKDLAFLLNQANGTSSSYESEHFYTKSPRHILLYNEILKFSKEELESVIKYDQPQIWSEVFNVRNPNPLFFSALIQKGAFIDQLAENTKYLLRYLNSESSIEFYNLILSVEVDKNNSLIPSICSFLFSLDTQEKKDLLEPLYLKYLIMKGKNSKEKIQELIEFCFAHPSSPLSSYLHEKMQENFIDINQNSILNRMLRKDDYFSSGSYSKFFISSQTIPTIKNLLEFGFRFNENNYFYYKNETLFTAVIKSGRKDIIHNIAPYLSQIKPFSGTQEEQSILVENLKNQSEEIYNIVAPHYYKLLLENSLPTKEVSKKRKI